MRPHVTEQLSFKDTTEVPVLCQESISVEPRHNSIVISIVLPKLESVYLHVAVDPVKDNVGSDTTALWSAA